MRTLRKGAKVRYIGDNSAAKGKVFRVSRKLGDSILLYFPLTYSDGSTHNEEVCMSSRYFELVKD